MHTKNNETTEANVNNNNFIIAGSLQQGQDNSIRIIQHLTTETKAASDWAVQATIPSVALMGLAALVALFLRKL